MNTMKRISALVLAMMMMLSAAACSTDTGKTDSKDNDKESSKSESRNDRDDDDDDDRNDDDDGERNDDEDEADDRDDDEERDDEIYEELLDQMVTGYLEGDVDQYLDAMGIEVFYCLADTLYEENKDELEAEGYDNGRDYLDDIALNEFRQSLEYDPDDEFIYSITNVEPLSIEAPYDETGLENAIIDFRHLWESYYWLTEFEDIEVDREGYNVEVQFVRPDDIDNLEYYVIKVNGIWCIINNYYNEEMQNW